MRLILDDDTVYEYQGLPISSQYAIAQQVRDYEIKNRRNNTDQLDLFRDSDPLKMYPKKGGE